MYELGYDPFTGKVASIKKGDMFIPLDEKNSDFVAFLKWNLAQAKPLDLKSTIEPVKPAPVRDLAAEVDLLKSKVTTLEAKVK